VSYHYVFNGHVDVGEQNRNTNMAGAEYHSAQECALRHYIRPVLFAFFQYGLPELKAFIKENLGIAVWEESVEAFQTWLTRPPGNEAPNPVKLYWWILMFWKRLPQLSQ